MQTRIMATEERSENRATTIGLKDSVPILRVFVLAVLAIFAGLMTFVSCDKLGGGDEESYELVPSGTSSETAAEYDASYYGLYKGVIIGQKSYGTIKFEIYNGNDDVKVFIRTGNRTDELTYTRAYIYNDVTKRQDEYIYPAPLPAITGELNMFIFFEGSFSSLMLSLTYSQDYYGRNYYNCGVSPDNYHIEGFDNLQFSLRKETSDNVVSVFEGTSEDSKGNKGYYVMLHDKYDGFYYFLRGEGDGMFIDSWFGKYISTDRISGSSYDYSSNINIEYETRLRQISVSNISGTWKTQWAGGTNNGTFVCDVPLKLSEL